MAQLHTLKITDGTNTIDLLSKNQQYGWKLRDATLNFPTFKGNGSWSDPSTSSGRSLTNYAITNANDLYELTLKASNANTFNAYLAEMRSMLFRAANYWVNGIDNPVWIEARGINESVTRYAIVKVGHLDGEGSHWGATFFQPDCEPVMEFSLAVERSLWRKYPPGEYEGVPTCSYLPGAEDATFVDILTMAYDDHIRVDGTDALELVQSDFALTFGIYFQVPPVSETQYLFTDGETIAVTIDFVPPDQATIGVLVRTDTTDAQTEILTPISFSNSLMYIDIVFVLSALRIDIYLDGELIEPSSQTIGTGTPLSHTNGEDFFIGNDPTTVVDPYGGPFCYFRLDQTTPVAIGSTRQILGEIVYLMDEGSGSTLDNSGTGGASNDGLVEDNGDNPNPPTWSQIQQGGIFGKTACSIEPTIVTNIDLPIPIDYIFYYNSFIAAYSTNKVLNSLPYTLTIPSPITGDYLYVGSTSGRFTHLLFDIDPASLTNASPTPAGLTKGIWEAWQLYRAGWDNFPDNDHYDTTRSLFVTGPGDVSGFTSITTDEWEKFSVNNVTAFWWRLPLVTGAYTTPSGEAYQINQHVYAGHSFINIPEYDGDTSALGRYEIYGASLSYNQNGDQPVSGVRRMVAGFRSESRGQDFIHNLSVVQPYLPDNILAVSSSGIRESTQFPGGFAVRKTMNVGVGDELHLRTWVIESDVAPQYYGTYKLFARVATAIAGDGDLGDTTGRLVAKVYMGSSKGNVANTDLIGEITGNDILHYPQADSQDFSETFIPYEIGTIRIPNVSRYNTQSEVQIEIYFKPISIDSVNDLIWLSDIVMIPVDEYAFTTIDGDLEESDRIYLGSVVNAPNFTDEVDMQTRKNLILDSVSWERDTLKSLEFTDTYQPLVDIPSGGFGKIGEGITGVWKFDSAQKIIIPNVSGGGRMFFVFPYDEYCTAIQVQLYANPEFYSLGEYG